MTGRELVTLTYKGWYGALPTARPVDPVVAVFAVMTGVGFKATEPVTQTGAIAGAAIIRPVEPETVTFTPAGNVTGSELVIDTKRGWYGAFPTARPALPVVAVFAVITGVGFKATEPVTHTGAVMGAATIRPVDPDTVTFTPAGNETGSELVIDTYRGWYGALPTAKPVEPVVAVFAVMTGVGLRATEPVTHVGPLFDMLTGCDRFPNDT